MITSQWARALWLMAACSACTQVNGISLGSASLPSDAARDSGMRADGDASARDGGHHHDDDDDDDDDSHHDGDDRFGPRDDKSGNSSLGISSTGPDAGTALGDAGDASLSDAESVTDDVDDGIEAEEP